MTYLAQYLCPARHCVVALPISYNGIGVLPDSPEAVEKLRQMSDEWLKRHGVNQHCGICGSKDLKWEVVKTKFATMEEAMIAMKAEQIKQSATRAFLDATGQSYDEQQKIKNN